MKTPKAPQLEITLQDSTKESVIELNPNKPLGNNTVIKLSTQCTQRSHKVRQTKSYIQYVCTSVRTTQKLTQKPNTLYAGLSVAAGADVAKVQVWEDYGAHRLSAL